MRDLSQRWWLLSGMKTPTISICWLHYSSWLCRFLFSSPPPSSWSSTPCLLVKQFFIPMSSFPDQIELNPANVQNLTVQAKKELAKYKKAGQEQRKKLGGEGELACNEEVYLPDKILLLIHSTQTEDCRFSWAHQGNDRPVWVMVWLEPRNYICVHWLAMPQVFPETLHGSPNDPPNGACQLYFPGSSPYFYLADRDFFQFFPPKQLANLVQQTCNSSLRYFLVALVCWILYTFPTFPISSHPNFSLTVATLPS